LAEGSNVTPEPGRIPGLAGTYGVSILVRRWLPAGVVAAASKRKQRIGDLLARTYVVRARDLAPPSSLIKRRR
jgi:uncharacterized RDD family membrane protein YckC